MPTEAGGPLPGSTVDRDRSALAVLEVLAAALLVAWFFVPWYSAGLSWGSYSPDALTTADLLIPFASLVAVVVTLAGMVLPARVAKIAILIAFAGALYGGVLRFEEVLASPAAMIPEPTAGPGLWLFTMTAAAGALLASVDLAKGGDSTLVWRLIRRPSLRRYGPGVAYIVALALTLPVAAFPMSPQWWLIAWCVALLITGPVWAVLARRPRP